MTPKLETINQPKQIASQNADQSDWKNVAIISFAISGLLLLIIFSLIIKRPMPFPRMMQGPLPPVITKSDIQQNTATPKPSSQETKRIDRFTYPSDSFFLSEGEASVESLSQNFDTDKELVELTLRHFVTNEEKSFTITMPTFDYISEPKISFREKYGCFSVSTSGYTGYYIFKLPGGEHIDTGKQYSSCITWVDDHRVMIAEKLYDTQKTSLYILDAETNSKKVISTLSQE